MEAKQQNQQANDIEIIEQRNSKVSNTVLKRYAKKRFLGKGGFAKCYEIENLETKKISAIKIVSKETLKKSKAKQKLVTQIKIHKSLQHRNIVGFDHVFQDADNVYMVLQLCGNHTLNQMIKKRKRISELELQYFLYQIIQGLIYVHQQKVIHRDLKLGNIMINDNMEIKIGDFGLAARIEYQGERRKTICGTPNYLAPEIVNNLGHSYEVDIWSLGVIIYTLLNGRPPFETSDVKKTYRRIKQCQYTFNDDILLSNNVKSLISKILVVDSSKRLTLQQILSHPFMMSNKIPKQMPQSVLFQPLPRSFVQQFTLLNQSGVQNKYNSTAKVIQSKNECQFQRTKSEKGISQRLLLRTTTGLNKNLFYNKQYQKEQLYQLKSNPQLLNNNFLKPDSAKSKNRTTLGGYNPVYVKKWVDYSSKYGLGYLLSDGTTGIYFNDATKMVIDQNGHKIDYMNNQIDENKRLFSFTVNSQIEDKEINKKLTLMQYFRKYLQGSTEGIRQHKDDPPFVYIKKWAKSDQAVVFRLNNKVIQVNFNDKSQIIIYTDKDIMLYSNGQAKQKIILQVNSLDIKKHPQLSQRYDHAKLLIRKLLQSQVQGEDRSEPMQIELLQHN